MVALETKIIYIRYIDIDYKHNQGALMAKNIVVLSDTIGSPDDELGHILMRAFILNLIASGEAVGQLILMNGAVRLACEGSQVLEALMELEERGTKISSCQTCLDYFGLLDSVGVGAIGNMAGTVSAILSADDTVTIG